MGPWNINDHNQEKRNDHEDSQLLWLSLRWRCWQRRLESMKRRTSLAWLILALLNGLLSLGFAGPATSGLPAQGEAALAQLKERGLYDSLQDALATARYGVYPEPQLATWRAGNPAQQIRARFTPEGVEVQAKPGRIGMKLRSVGYGERTIGVSAARLTTSGSRIEYRRSLMGKDSAAGAITEWYVNTAAGLEQGFTLESAPGERREGSGCGWCSRWRVICERRRWTMGRRWSSKTMRGSGCCATTTWW